MKSGDQAGQEAAEGVCPCLWVPYEIHSFLPLWVVGTIIGATTRVDMRYTRKTGVMRIQVAVLDIDNIADEADIVVDDCLYEIFFKIDHIMPLEEEENFDDADDLDDEDGENQDKEAQGDDQEMEEAQIPEDDANGRHGGHLAPSVPSASGTKPVEDTNATGMVLEMQGSGASSPKGGVFTTPSPAAWDMLAMEEHHTGLPTSGHATDKQALVVLDAAASTLLVDAVERDKMPANQLPSLQLPEDYVPVPLGAAAPAVRDVPEHDVVAKQQQAPMLLRRVGLHPTRREEQKTL